VHVYCVNAHCRIRDEVRVVFGHVFAYTKAEAVDVVVKRLADEKHPDRLSSGEYNELVDACERNGLDPRRWIEKNTYEVSRTALNYQRKHADGHRISLLQLEGWDPVL